MKGYVRYSKQLGFYGITSEDEERWKRKYPHIDDFELNVKECKEWLSKHWNKAQLAERQPEKVLNWWLGGEWEHLSNDEYKEPEKIHNPKQLIDFIQRYFNNNELIERVIRGKRDGYSDTLATKHYDKALGHAVKLREEVPDFPPTPDTMGKPLINLRKFQEWCIECQKIVTDLITRIKLESLDKSLSLLLELRELRKSAPPPINQTKLDKIRDRIWSELERLLKVIDESGESVRHWRDKIEFGQDYELLLKILAENEIHVPDNKEELVEMFTAAEWMAKVDWDRVKTVEEELKKDKTLTTQLNILDKHSYLFSTAQVAEQKINDFVWRTYCFENQDYAKAVNERQEHIIKLFDETTKILNSDKSLLKVAYLRKEKLNSAFERLNDRLFGTLTLRSVDDDPLNEIIEELKAIRDDFIQRRRTIPREELEQKVKIPNEPTEISQYPVDNGNFLIKIASSVHELIQDQTNRECFQKQLSGFRKLKNEFDHTLKEAQEVALDDPKLRYDYDDVRDKDKDPPPPPVEGYEVERYYVLDAPPKGFWRPPLPFNPDGWLSHFQFKCAGLIHPLREEPRNRDQMLMCIFALLAAIHDEALHIPVCDRLTDRNQDDWVESLWIGVSHEGWTADDIGTFPDRQNYIETALNDVKAELTKKQTETEQKERDNKVLRNLAEELKSIITRLAAQPKVQLLEDIRQVQISMEKLGQSDVGFDNISREESIYAEAMVVEYLKERYGEQDDTLGNWPTDWHECPKAYYLYMEKVKEFRTAKAKANIDRFKDLVEKLTNIEQEVASVEKPKTSSWNEVSLDFIDDETIRYKIGKSKWKRVNYAEIDFQDKRTGMKRKIWSTFINLAKNCKNGHVIDCKTPENISKDLDLICKKLRLFFGPKDRPILYNKRDKNWKVKFRLTYKIQDTEISF